jgi:hypothetical protein
VKESRPLKRTLEGVRDMVKNMSRHEVSFMLVGKHFDELQTEYLLQGVHNILGSDPLPEGYYPNLSVAGVHAGPESFAKEESQNADRLFNHLRKEPPPKNKDDDDHDVKGTKPAALKKRKLATPKEVYKIKSRIKKHGLVRPKVKGSGSSYAILTDLEGFRNVLMKALSFHSFVHYFEEVPSVRRADVKYIERTIQGFINDFSDCIYRGDDSVDCDTCKIHSHLHLAADIKEYGHPMNWEAGKGERGLKVWAKQPVLLLRRYGCQSSLSKPHCVFQTLHCCLQRYAS